MKKSACAAVLILFFVFLPGMIFAGGKKEFSLSEIIHLGLENNPSLASQYREVEARKSAYENSRKWVNPDLEIQSGRGKLIDNSGSRNTGSFSLSQVVENPFKRHYRIQMAQDRWKAEECFLKASQVDITYEIRRLFYEILWLKAKEEFAQKNIDSIQKIYDLIEKRAKAGEVKQLEAIKLHVETLKAQYEINTLQTEIQIARENLNKFLGNALPQDFAIKGELAYTPFSEEDDRMLESALRTHPLLKKKEKELELAENHVNLVKWQRLPDFTVSGFIENEIDGKNTGLGISVELPLWNFRTREVAEVENIYLGQTAAFEALKQEISTEIKTFLHKLKLDERALTLFHEGLLKQAQESLKIAEVSYREGEISLIDYLDSQRTYYSILKDYQDSLFAWNVDRAALEKALGEEIQ